MHAQLISPLSSCYTIAEASINNNNATYPSKSCSFMMICASGFMSGFCKVLHFACLFFRIHQKCNASSKSK